MKQSLLVSAMLVFGFLSPSVQAGATATTIDSGHIDELTGTVTITGTVTCNVDSSSDTVAVDVSARQQLGDDNFASGSSTVIISSDECNNTPVEYIVHFASVNVDPFRAGTSATVNAFAHNTNERSGDATASARSDLLLNP